MELRDQLEFCRKCTNRELNSLEAIVCSLTHKKPDFEITCKNFVKDSAEPEQRLDDTTSLGFNEIASQIDFSIYSKMQLEQKFFPALFSGLIVSVIGALLWAVISVITEYQIGYMALAVGIMVGFAVRYTGKGFEMTYALMGAILSFFGCALGNFLAIVGFVSKEYNIGYFQIFSNLSLGAVIQVMVETFRFIDVLFYGLAIYWGFNYSTIKYTEKSLWAYSQKFK